MSLRCIVFFIAFGVNSEDDDDDDDDDVMMMMIKIKHIIIISFNEDLMLGKQKK